MLVTNKYCNLNIQYFICFDNLNDFSLDLQIDILSIQFNGVIVIGIVIGNHFLITVESFNFVGAKFLWI